MCIYQTVLSLMAPKLRLIMSKLNMNFYLEKDHNLKVEELKRQKKEEVDSLIDQHKDNPDELAKEIAKLIGAEHVDTP